MTAQPTPAALARTFTEAWTSHDMQTAARYLTDDVIFDGPAGSHSQGAEAYMAGLNTFARAITGVKVVAALGDETQALVMYELTTGPFGTLTCAEHLTFRDGKIATDRLTYDNYAVRAATLARQAAAQAVPAE